MLASGQLQRRGVIAEHSVAPLRRRHACQRLPCTRALSLIDLVFPVCKATLTSDARRATKLVASTCGGRRRACNAVAVAGAGAGGAGRGGGGGASGAGFEGEGAHAGGEARHELLVPLHAGRQLVPNIGQQFVVCLAASHGQLKLKQSVRNELAQPLSYVPIVACDLPRQQRSLEDSTACDQTRCKAARAFIDRSSSRCCSFTACRPVLRAVAPIVAFLLLLTGVVPVRIGGW